MPRPTSHSYYLAALAALGLAPAHAQQLEDVVISASRAEMRSFDAPAAVQRIDRQAIESGGPQINLSESLVRAPGLTILERQNYAQDLQISIRGFGARSAFGVRGIRLMIDGIPATTPDGQGQSSSVSLTSTDRIEVLRGPLAQLYGNSSGGVIQAFTKEASKVPTVDYQYYLGSYGLRRADYQFSDTVGDFGLVADYGTFSTDGYRANSAAERKQFNGKLSFQPNEQTKVNVVFNQFDMPLAQDPLGLKQDRLIADPTEAGPNAIKNGTRKIVSQSQLGTSIKYVLDADSSISTRVYYGTRENLQYQATALGAGTWVNLGRTYYGTGLQYNGRFNWGDVPLEVAGGYEFDRSTERRTGGAAAAGEKTAGSPTRDEDSQAQNSDFFLQTTAHVSEQFSLVGGFRQSNVSFNSTDNYLLDNIDGSGNANFGASSPVLGITWHADDTLNLYANYGQGFESPTLAEMAYSTTSLQRPTPLFNPLLNASKSRHYEIGAKWTPLRQTRLDFAMYQIDTTDEIVSAVNSGGQTSFKNAPGTTRRGWEFALNTQFANHFSASLSASSIDAQYSQEFSSIFVVSNVPSTRTVSAGKKIPGIPQASTFAELAWSSEPLSTGKKAPNGTRVALEWQQSGRIFANDLNTESADGRNVFNLALSQRWAWNQALLTLYGRLNNIADERYVGSIIVNQSALQFYEPAMPQNWMVGLSLSVPLR